MRIYQDATQQLPTNTDLRLKFQATENIDSDYTVNTARDLVTINRAGVYLVTASARLSGVGGGGPAQGERYIGIGGANGPANANERRYGNQGGVHPGGNWSANVCVPVRYAVGDVVGVWTWHNAGAPITTAIGAVSPGNRTTHLTIVRIGD